MTTTEIANRTNKIVDLIQHADFLEQLRESLPEGVTLERFKRVTITAIRSNAELAGADEGSLFASIVKCAQDGLLPDGREAALVIYSGKVQYLPMIGGYRKIAADHGWTLQTQTVREGDEFEFEEGLDPKLIHRRARPADRGDLVNAYAIAQHVDGRKLFVVLDEAEIQKCREVSKAKDKAGAPWTTWTERMWEKTAGKRLFKQLPLGELDQERLKRMLAAERSYERALADPTAALYGPEGNGVAVQREDGRTAAVRAGDTDDGRGVVPLGESDAAAADLEADDAVWTPVDEAPAATEEEIAAAGRLKVGKGAFLGKTIAEVAEATEPVVGTNWLLAQLKKDGCPAEVATFVRGRLTEAWAAHQAWLEEQS